MTFSQTCNLLSHYVKDKRVLSMYPIPSRGEMTSDGFNNHRATMDLFPVKKETVAEDSNGCIGRSINLFPQSSGLNSSFLAYRPLMANACASKRVSTEPSTAQMTIFYGGQVLVFNELPGDKAKKVMDLAKSFEPSLKKRKVENPNLSQSMNVAPNIGQCVIPATIPRPALANFTDLPIARKASLHRFLEKRKDRLVGKAPPSVDVNSGAQAKPVEGKPWLGLTSLPVFHQQQF